MPMKLPQEFNPKMGNSKSKGKARDSREKDKPRKETKYGSKKELPPEIETPATSVFPEVNDATDHELRRMRRTLLKDPEAFILNNLTLSVQFFKSYEQEILNIRKTPKSEREIFLNKGLSLNQKHVLLPDVLQEHIAENVKFTSTRQTLRTAIEPLQPVRIYVVLDNVDITEQSEASEYSSLMNAITYNMSLQASQHEGYVKLQRLEVTPPRKSLSADEDSDTAKDEDELYTDGDRMFDPKPNPGQAFLNQVEQRLNASSKPAFTQSMTDLLDDDTSLYGQKSQSHTNLYFPKNQTHYKDESEYTMSARRLSGTRKPLSDQAIRGQINRKPKQKLRQENRQKISNGSPASSTSSGYRSGSYGIDSDSDYGYSTITNFNTPKPLVAFRGSKVTRCSSEIPLSCFKKITYTRHGKIYDEKEEKRQHLTSKQRRIKVAMKHFNYDRYYFSSAEFMKHFRYLFSAYLSRMLGFNEEDVADAMWQGSVIYCDMVELLNRNRAVIVPYEIIPSVQAQWPTYANEWPNRIRNEIYDLVTDKPYVWPPYDAVRKVEELGCYILPEGFMPKREVNREHEIEWQLAFPAAERYLETCFSYTQLRVYLLALMLHKTFIRPVDITFGLTTTHIRNQLFWLCEDNSSPSMWPNNRIGECLMRLLRRLYNAISQSQPNLPDFFIREKNMFQNVPRENLLMTQKQLKRIMENPVMYVISTMENIRYKEEFFPVLDYKKLHHILTADLLVLSNPALVTQVAKPLTTPEAISIYDEPSENTGGFWVKAKKLGDESLTATNRTVINSTHNAHDQVIEITTRCEPLEGPRLSALLELFINHFIKMSERCYLYGAVDQAEVYVNQTERLAILLSEHARYKDDAIEYLESVVSMKERLTRLRSLDEPPETPKRNDAPSFSSAFKDRFTNQPLGPSFISLPMPEETKEYDLANRRPTVAFQEKAQHFDRNGVVTVVEVNNIELQSLETSRTISLISEAGAPHDGEVTYI